MNGEENKHNSDFFEYKNISENFKSARTKKTDSHNLENPTNICNHPKKSAHPTKDNTYGLEDRLIKLNQERSEIQNRLKKIQYSRRRSSLNLNGSIHQKKSTSRKNSFYKNQKSIPPKNVNKNISNVTTNTTACTNSDGNSYSTNFIQENNHKVEFLEKNHNSWKSQESKRTQFKKRETTHESEKSGNQEYDPSNIIDSEYNPLDFLRDYEEQVNWSTIIMEDFLDPPFLYSFLLQEIFRTTIIWVERFLNNSENRKKLWSYGLEYCFENLSNLKAELTKNGKAVIESARETWFSFFSSVDDTKQIELQYSLQNIFTILIQENSFTELLYRQINIAMYMKARSDRLFMNISNLHERYMFITYFDNVRMKSIFSGKVNGVHNSNGLAVLVLPEIVSTNGMNYLGIKPYYIHQKEAYKNKEIFFGGKKVKLSDSIDQTKLFSDFKVYDDKDPEESSGIDSRSLKKTDSKEVFKNYKDTFGSFDIVRTYDTKEQDNNSTKQQEFEINEFNVQKDSKTNIMNRQQESNSKRSQLMVKDIEIQNEYGENKENQQISSRTGRFMDTGSSASSREQILLGMPNSSDKKSIEGQYIHKYQREAAGFNSVQNTSEKHGQCGAEFMQVVDDLENPELKKQQTNLISSSANNFSFGTLRNNGNIRPNFGNVSRGISGNIFTTNDEKGDMLENGSNLSSKNTQMGLVSNSKQNCFKKNKKKVSIGPNNTKEQLEFEDYERQIFKKKNSSGIEKPEKKKYSAQRSLSKDFEDIVKQEKSKTNSNKKKTDIPKNSSKELPLKENTSNMQKPEYTQNRNCFQPKGILKEFCKYTNLNEKSLNKKRSISKGRSISQRSKPTTTNKPRNIFQTQREARPIRSSKISDREASKTPSLSVKHKLPDNDNTDIIDCNKVENSPLVEVKHLTGIIDQINYNKHDQDSVVTKTKKELFNNKNIRNAPSGNSCRDGSNKKNPNEFVQEDLIVEERLRQNFQRERKLGQINRERSHSHNIIHNDKNSGRVENYKYRENFIKYKKKMFYDDSTDNSISLSRQNNTVSINNNSVSHSRNKSLLIKDETGKQRREKRQNVRKFAKSTEQNAPVDSQNYESPKNQNDNQQKSLFSPNSNNKYDQNNQARCPNDVNQIHGVGGYELFREDKKADQESPKPNVTDIHEIVTSAKINQKPTISKQQQRDQSNTSKISNVQSSRHPDFKSKKLHSRKKSSGGEREYLNSFINKKAFDEDLPQHNSPSKLRGVGSYKTKNITASDINRLAFKSGFSNGRDSSDQNTKNQEKKYKNSRAKSPYEELHRSRISQNSKSIKRGDSSLIKPIDSLANSYQNQDYDIQQSILTKSAKRVIRGIVGKSFTGKDQPLKRHTDIPNISASNYNQDIAGSLNQFKTFETTDKSSVESGENFLKKIAEMRNQLVNLSKG